MRSTFLRILAAVATWAIAALIIAAFLGVTLFIPDQLPDRTAAGEIPMEASDGQ